MLEIACFNKESAVIAAKAGADRIEFCADFHLGGTTPDLEDFQSLKKEIDVPIYVMIRPRGGNFFYSDEGFSLMKHQLQNFYNAGADGFVFGILDQNNEVNEEQCKELVQFAKGKPCTFHRAFDRTKNLEKSLEKLINCGFSTVLTSGGKSNVEEGKEMLQKLVEISAGRIDILCGGGLRSSNLVEIKNFTHAKSFHSSAILEGEVADFHEITRLKSCF